MATITTTNPATGETLRTYELMSRAEALAGLARVHAVQPGWGLCLPANARRSLPASPPCCALTPRNGRD